MYTQPQKTKEELLKEKVSRIVQSANGLIDMIKAEHTMSFIALWSHENPQEIFDLLGSESALMFRDSHGIQTLLKTVDPDYELLVPPYEYTINQDGTVTIGDKIGELPNRY